MGRLLQLAFASMHGIALVQGFAVCVDDARIMLQVNSHSKKTPRDIDTQEFASTAKEDVLSADVLSADTQASKAAYHGEGLGGLLSPLGKVLRQGRVYLSGHGKSEQLACVAAVCVLLNICLCFWCCRKEERKDEPECLEGSEIWTRRKVEIPSDRQILTALFGRIDSQDHGNHADGYVTLEELHRALSDRRLAAELLKFGFSPSECANVFRMLDWDNSGHVSLEEFVSGCLARMKS